jgi:hypothetical protein
MGSIGARGAGALLSNSNTKLKKDGIYSFGIPAGFTCPYAGSCKAICYAQKGMFRFRSVQAAQARRFEATRREDFVAVMTAEITRRKVKRLRIHDSGDFYSAAYRDKWIAIAKACPEVHFYAYTKSVKFFLGVALPENLRIIFSLGGKLDHLVDPQKHRHARIFDSESELRKSGYVASHKRDLPAAVSPSLQIGLVLH